MNLQVDWVDQDREQLKRLKEFLKLHGVEGHLGETWTRGRKYYELSVSEGNNALGVLKGMLPYVDKKLTQVRAAVDYLENRTTGEEFIKTMNHAIIHGKRSSTVKTVVMPYTRARGLLIARSSRRLGKTRALTPRQVMAMRYDREASGMSYNVLAIKYGVSVGTVYRLLERYVQRSATFSS